MYLRERHCQDHQFFLNKKPDIAQLSAAHTHMYHLAHSCSA